MGVQADVRSSRGFEMRHMSPALEASAGTVLLQPYLIAWKVRQPRAVVTFRLADTKD
jgi:hypothetical protein